MRRRRLFASALVVALLAVEGLSVVGAVPDAAIAKTYPSKKDVKKAHAAEAGARHDVTVIQQQLAVAQKQADAADLALSIAAENYDEAVVELSQAKADAKAAQQVADRANQRLDDAQVQVGRLAAATYREGGPIASLDVLLSPGGPDAVLERATVLRTVATERQRTVHSMDSARVSATSLQQQADLAMKRQQAAAVAMEAARAEAQAKARAAASAVASTKALQGKLVAKLAKAHSTSVKVERARQAGLAAAARRRAEAAARAAAARAAARQRSSGGDNNSNPAPVGGGSSGSAGGGVAAVNWARQRVGLPYLWGGDGPNSYDCSGLTMRAWQQAGVYLPHSSRIQYQVSEKVSYGQLRPGDLIFYATNPGDPSTIHHVTLYAGNGMMIEAPHTGADVRWSPVRRGGSMPYAGRP